MEGGRELGFLRPTAGNVREQAARMTLTNVRKQGHTYVELREDGRRLIFFCALCLSPCYSDTVLFDHLRGNLHTRRNAVAKATLFGSNPWPFNDGFHFFDTSNENGNEPQSGNSSGSPLRLLDASENSGSLAVVKYNGGTTGGDTVYSENRDLIVNEGDCDMLIPGVLLKEKISNLKLTYVGSGQIGARFVEKNQASKGMSRIWCKWLGKKDLIDEDIFNVPQHDFAVVVFSYTYEMGRQSLFNDLLSSQHSAKQDYVERPKKKGKCYSDPEDMGESLRCQFDSSREYSLAPLTISSPARLLLDQNVDVGLISSSKTVRRELRRKQRVAAERACDICQQKMLPHKDVAALLNMKTERLACNRRNEYGAFHMYHTSCLVHWILFCEYEICRNQLFTEQLFTPEAKAGSKRKKSRAKGSCKPMENDSETKSHGNKICFVFCPQCQGTADIKGDDLEKPTIVLSEMFKHKIRLSDAHRAWMKSPEALQNCSTGLTFPSDSDEAIEEKVLSLKLLHFYRAKELIKERPNGIN